MTTVADLARRLKPGPGGRDLPPLILMTDDRRLPDPLPVLSGLPRGSAVLLRHYGVAGRDELAARLAAACRSRGLRLLVGADARLAAAVGADGVHWPEALAGRVPRPWRCWRRAGWLVTAAAHSYPAVLRARAWGADAVLVSPVFATASHPDAPPLGHVRLAAWAAAAPVPLYALGGVTPDTAARVIAGGAHGLAGIGFLAGGPSARKTELLL